MAVIHPEPLDQVPVTQSIDDTVDQAINRALQKRPDLMERVAEIRSANARVKEARAAFYPALSLNVSPAAQSLYGLQSPYPWSHTADLVGGISFNLQWTVFDGGARKNKLAQAQANDIRPETIGSTHVIVRRIPAADREQMRSLVDSLRVKYHPAVVVLGASTADGGVSIVSGVTKDLAGKVHAGKLVAKVAQATGGKGGGRPDMAEGGGKDASALDAGLESARQAITEALGG